MCVESKNLRSVKLGETENLVRKGMAFGFYEINLVRNIAFFL